MLATICNGLKSVQILGRAGAASASLLAFVYGSLPLIIDDGFVNTLVTTLYFDDFVVNHIDRRS